MSEKNKFQRLARRYFNWLYRHYPVAATSLGVHRYDDYLTDFDPKAIRARLTQIKIFLKEFRKIKPLSLSLKNTHNYRVLTDDIKWDILSAEKIKYWQKAPSVYSDEIIWGLYFLVNRRFARQTVRAQSLLARLKAAPLVLEQGKRNLKRPCLVWVEIALDSVKGGIIFFKVQVSDFAQKTKNPSLRKEILQANNKLVKVFEDYLRFLRQIKKKAQKDFAIGKLLFEKKLKLAGGIDWSTDELLQIGWEIFNQTEKELEKLAETIKPGSLWWQTLEDLKKNHPSRQKLLEVYRQEVKRLKRFLRQEKIVPLLRGEKLRVIDTPESERATTPYAAYLSPAPFEKDQTGQFWVTPINIKKSLPEQKKQLQEHAYAHLPITVLHESYPGHHLQLVIANQKTSYVRKHFHSTPYVEGWALYCEQLMVETGYLGKPELRLAQLQAQLWRAARIIIDVSLHTNRMTFRQAVNFLIKRVHLEKNSAFTEVRRYTLTPTYPLSYMIGKWQILALREKIKKKQKDKFTLKKFHQSFLLSGSIPIKFVEKEILASF